MLLNTGGALSRSVKMSPRGVVFSLVVIVSVGWLGACLPEEDPCRTPCFASLKLLLDDGMGIFTVADPFGASETAVVSDQVGMDSGPERISDGEEGRKHKMIWTWVWLREGRRPLLEMVLRPQQAAPNYVLTIRSMDVREFCPSVHYLSLEIPEGWYAQYSGQKYSSAVKVKLSEGTNEQVLKLYRRKSDTGSSGAKLDYNPAQNQVAPSPGVTDEDLAHLEDRENLRELWLGGAEVTDEGLAHLEGLKNLKMLDLRGTRVTDKGLSHLEGLRNLQVLVLIGTDVTDEGVRELKEALPEVTVHR